MDPDDLKLKQECQKNIGKVEKMLKRDGQNIPHEKFEEETAKAFGGAVADEEVTEAKPAWAILLPAYYAFEWVVSSLKARFGEAENNDPMLTNGQVSTAGETSAITDPIQEAT